MKKNFLATALKALKKQRNVYQTDRDRYEVAEKSAKQNKEDCETQLLKLDAQIKSLESEDFQKELDDASKKSLHENLLT